MDRLAMVKIPNLPPMRWLTKKEAAYYCRLSERRFTVKCPLSPVEIDSGKKLYDITKIDEWIRSLEDQNNITNDDDIIIRVG